MLIPTASKKCMACEKPILGRADKKFCNDYCRNAYNNQLKTNDQAIIRTINSYLLRNRKIISQTLGEEKMAKVTKDKLLRQGFNFQYQTHRYTTKEGKVYIFCYEYGYLPLDNDWYLLVKRKED